MSDSSPETSPSNSSTETAQPFFYAPPNGDSQRHASGSPHPSDSDGRESLSGHAAPDQAVQKAYERGLAEGKASARAEFEKTATEMRSEISGAVRAFSKERADYFGRVEVEVVRLSLSVARKILHRESQIDPLVLTGVVHVALQKINTDSTVRLRTHPDELRFWGDYFRNTKDIYPTVNVVGDASLPPGHCTLETDFGTTQISLDTQLKEIEQGFFDLLAQRPKEQ